MQLESVSAVENAQQIAEVEGVTGVFFGPSDIAADLGLVGQPMHPRVWELIGPAAKQLISRNISVGTLVSNTEFAARLLKDGFSYLACGIDTVLLAQAADELLSQVKAQLK